MNIILLSYVYVIGVIICHYTSSMWLDEEDLDTDDDEYPERNIKRDILLTSLVWPVALPIFALIIILALLSWGGVLAYNKIKGEQP